MMRVGSPGREHVILVDDEDRPLGLGEKLEVHRLGLRHRAVSVLIFDGSGRMLIQQRSPSKYHSGGLWTNACCSHPRGSESAEDAAARRLDEEMGFRCPLEYVARTAYSAPVGSGLHESEIVHVFRGRYHGPVCPDPNEVHDYRWVAADALCRDIGARPERYTAWFRIYREQRWFVP